MTRWQRYSHYKLPITMNPLDYGQLIDQTSNKFIIQLTTKNIAVIIQNDKENFIKIFRNGVLILEFRDKLVHDNSFIRKINDSKFLFENNNLMSTQISTVSGLVTIFNSNEHTPYHESNVNPIYKDTNSIKLKGDTLFPEWLEKSKYAAEMFIIFELSLLLIVYLIFFVILPIETNITTYSAHSALLFNPFQSIKRSFSYNIIKLRRLPSKNIWNELILNYWKSKINLNKLDIYLICIVLGMLLMIFGMVKMLFSITVFSGTLNSFCATFVLMDKVRKRKAWSESEFKCNKKLFTKTLFNSKFEEFWSEIENNFTGENHMYIIFKINYHETGYSSIGQLQRLTKHDKNWYLNWILNNLLIKAEYYNESPIESLLLF